MMMITAEQAHNISNNYEIEKGKHSIFKYIKNESLKGNYILFFYINRELHLDYNIASALEEYFVSLGYYFWINYKEEYIQIEG